MRRIIRTPSITKEIVDELIAYHITKQIKNETPIEQNVSTPSNWTKDEIKEICCDTIRDTTRETFNKPSELLQEEKVQEINLTFTDEEPIKLLTIDLNQDEVGAFTIKIYLNIFVNDEKNTTSKYVECIWSGIKQRNDEYFITNSEIMFSTITIKSSSLNLDIGNVQLSTSYNKLYAIIDILPTVKGSKTGKIKGFYSIIKHNDNINIC